VHTQRKEKESKGGKIRQMGYFRSERRARQMGYFWSERRVNGDHKGIDNGSRSSRFLHSLCETMFLATLPLTMITWNCICP